MADLNFPLSQRSQMNRFVMSFCAMTVVIAAPPAFAVDFDALIHELSATELTVLNIAGYHANGENLDRPASRHEDRNAFERDESSQGGATWKPAKEPEGHERS
jgi:hypothetical protein